ncbi:response regulator [Arenimonas sp.]|nr:response regulator [Candidatus Parcubacteria bacterium]
MKKHILLIEDEEFIAKVYKHFFIKENFTVDSAKNSIIAKKMLKANTPNIIVLDLMLPGESGFKILEKLKAEKKTKHIPVIIISNISLASDIEKCKNLGAIEYIIKSNFSMREVIDKVHKHIL